MDWRTSCLRRARPPPCVLCRSGAPGHPQPVVTQENVCENESLKPEVTVAEPLPEPGRGPLFAVDNVGTLAVVMNLLRPPSSSRGKRGTHDSFGLHVGPTRGVSGRVLFRTPSPGAAITRAPSWTCQMWLSLDRVGVGGVDPALGLRLCLVFKPITSSTVLSVVIPEPSAAMVTTPPPGLWSMAKTWARDPYRYWERTRASRRRGSRRFSQPHASIFTRPVGLVTSYPPGRRCSYSPHMPPVGPLSQQLRTKVLGSSEESQDLGNCFPVLPGGVVYAVCNTAHGVVDVWSRHVC